MLQLLLTLAANLIILALFFVWIVRRFERRFSSKRILDEVRSEMSSLMVELNGTTDRNVSLIEDRIEQLGSLLKRADKRLSILQREMEKYQLSADRYDGSGRRVGAGSQGASNTARGESAETRVPEPASSEKPELPELFTDSSVGESANSDESEAPLPPLRERVFDLHRQGISPDLIAARTGSTLGEVELIISLGERRQ
jgi:hypothetical protein